MTSSKTLPVIDVTPLIEQNAETIAAEQIRSACRSAGFFYITGHGISDELMARLDAGAREFFAWDLQDKMKVSMKRGGRAWRGYFAVGDELTSGIPDSKEGIYFGSELSIDHPQVRAGIPLHGANLFPEIPGFRETVLEYLQRFTDLGHSVMRGIALSLDLEADFFENQYTRDPTILFRVFHYPGQQVTPESWGVGEHTDYGLLTILRQDDCGGLQVKYGDDWIHAPPIDDAFVCNIGDMLDRMTGGLYRSTPHRVRVCDGRGRLSFPFFFDPSFDAEIRPILPIQARHDRWDGTDLQELTGTYGEYLLKKVSRVFPQLVGELE